MPWCFELLHPLRVELSDAALFTHNRGTNAVACRGLVMPGATARLYAPLPSSGIEQWRMVVVVTR